MARYLVQASYDNAAVSELIKSPQDRAAAVRGLVESLGGKLESFDYAFGDYDVVAIADVPDNLTMMALSMAVAAGGALKAFKTTVLISMSDAIEAMRKAGALTYRPPGG